MIARWALALSACFPSEGLAGPVKTPLALLAGAPAAQCSMVSGIVREERELASQVTALTPNSDRVLAGRKSEAAAKLAKLNIEDGQLRAVAKELSKALNESSAATLAFAVLYEQGKTPSAAIQQRVRKAAIAEQRARDKLRPLCSP